MIKPFSIGKNSICQLFHNFSEFQTFMLKHFAQNLNFAPNRWCFNCPMIHRIEH